MTNESRSGGYAMFGVTMLLCLPAALSVFVSAQITGNAYHSSALWFMYQVSQYIGMIGIVVAAALTIIKASDGTTSRIAVILMGFSQPVGLNYRFIGTHPQSAGGVIAICGGVPKDWEEEKYSRVEAPILHIARSEDEFFPEAVARGFPDRLRAHAADVEFHMLPGEHRFPSKASATIRAFAEKISAS